MQNRFEYSQDIPRKVLDKLLDREPLCAKAVFETSPLGWTREIDDQKRPLYVLTKHGLVDFRLGIFSEDEILNMTDEIFKDKILIQDIDEQRRQETEYVVERLEDWKNRLTHLFTEIDHWTPQPWQILHSQIIQRNEELMRRFDVAPKEVPILTLLNGKQRVAFVPSALWIVGADGRVNVTINARQYILIDRRDTSLDASRWEIILGNQRSQTVPFTQEEFLSLLRGVS